MKRYEDEIELVKPKFDIKDYPGKYVMHCNTEEAAKTFCNYLHSLGKNWCSGESYLNKTEYGDYKDSTVYYFNNGRYGQYSYVNYYDFDDGYTILEFEDFDWEESTMKKEFTKKDLRNGDVIRHRNDRVGIICVETGTIIYTDGFNGLRGIDDDLTNMGSGSKEWDIMEVRRPKDPSDCKFSAIKFHHGELVYERKEVEEMTLEEVCKALGKEIKIVKK